MAAVLVVAAGGARFGLHLLEMCAAMCLGVALLNLPLLALARAAGYSDPVTELPEIAAVMVAFNMAAPMALWMRLRHHDWRCIGEMSAAMFIEALVLIVAATEGVFPKGIARRLAAQPDDPGHGPRHAASPRRVRRSLRHRELA